MNKIQDLSTLKFEGMVKMVNAIKKIKLRISDVKYTDLYKKVIKRSQMLDHFREYGKEIHFGGTVELVYFENKEGDFYSLRLDVLDDIQTPSFHVKKNSDDEYLEVFDNYEEAEKDFYRIINM